MSGIASPEGKMGWAATHDTREPLYFGVSDYPRLSYIAQRHHTIQDPCRR